MKFGVFFFFVINKMSFNPDNNFILFNNLSVYDSDISDNSICSIDKTDNTLLKCKKIDGRLIDGYDTNIPYIPQIFIDSPTTMQAKRGYQWERVGNGNYFVQVPQSISTSAGKIMIGADIFRQQMKDSTVL